MTKIAVITGITGQDGGYLAKFLLKKNYKVIGLYRKDSTNSFSRLKEHGIFDQIELVCFDLLRFSSVCKIIKKYKPDEFYNLAAQSFVGASWNQPIYTAQADAVGVAYILEAIREFSPNTKFFQASSSEMFGNVKKTPQNEKTAFYPCSPYGCAKLHAHWLTTNYRENFGIYTCSGILYNHESPMRGKNFVTRKITDYFARLSLSLVDKPLELGNINIKRDWGHAKDYVEGMWLMLQQKQGDTYILSTGKTYTIKEFVTLVGKHTGFDIDWQGKELDEIGIDKKTGKIIVKINPEFFRPAETQLLCGDNTKARTKLGWTPKYDLDMLAKEMIQADIDRYESKNGDTI